MNYISSEFAKESSNFDFSSWLQQRVFRVHIWNISIPKGLMKGQHTLTLSCGVAITALFFSFLQRTIFWERQVPSSPLVSLWYHCAHYSYDKVALCKLFFSSHCGFIRNRKEFQFAFYFQKNRAGSLLRRPHLSMSSNNFFLSLFLVPLDQRVFSREGTNSFEIPQPPSEFLYFILECLVDIHELLNLNERSYEVLTFRRLCHDYEAQI